MNAGFEADALERRYATIEECPPELLPSVITLPIGNLNARIAGTRQWNDALLDGRLPDPGTWPDSPIDTPARQALESLQITRFCKNQPDLVIPLMLDILDSFEHQHTAFESHILRELEELEKLEHQKNFEQTPKQKKQQPRPMARGKKPEPDIDKQTLQSLRDQARQLAIPHMQTPDPDILGEWQERVRVWSQVSDVFGDLSDMLGRGWDMTQGILKHTGWLELLRLQELLEQLPQLREIIQSLGRLHSTENGESVAQIIFTPVQRIEEERRETPTPLVPSETRGIERSGEIPRMLPSEAVLFGHPKLRMLWHARRAERALLTYRVEGIEIERTQVEHEEMVGTEVQRPRPERGPIIAVIDTSGSMHGTPEQVAKAIVLEAARTAHAEKRPCYLYAWSGPGQVMEHELDLSPDGIGRLLQFLGYSFGGGTDIGMMTQVLAHLNENRWTKADIILVSDGEWSAAPSLVQAVQQAREQGTRFHGVQIGSRYSGFHGHHNGFQAICDPVHIFQDWAALGGWR